MQLQVPVSVGEVLDKITILQIKLVHISDAAKRINVQNELDALVPLVAGDPFDSDQMQVLIAELKAINEVLWNIEDDIREKQEERELRRVNREARSAQRKVERMAAQVHRGFQDFVETRMEIWTSILFRNAMKNDKSR